jgi:hypothetical protein
MGPGSMVTFILAFQWFLIYRATSDWPELPAKNTPVKLTIARDDIKHPSIVELS